MAETSPDRGIVPSSLDELLRPEKCALVLWDLQNGLAGQTGETPRLAPVWRKLMGAARESGALIVRSRHLAPRPELMDLLTRWRITRRTHGENRPDHYMQPGGQDTAFLEGFEPEPDELVIEKSVPSLFHNTPADARLRARGITTVLLAGVATDIGIDFTARHAMAYGYFTAVIEDASASYTREAHEHAMAILRPSVFVASSDEVIAGWSRHGAA
ncbi:cysteine hydrolase family protein [Nocardia alni]|uniref:cysteine hydrolase family protein n=1 Tax=Nocardia alni TaxID=2815723 RepID=UPI001C21BC4D|nr:isochorismatase family cysteine hydrolase [Nocardia alni]